MKKLNAGQIHALRLIDRDQKDGWCPVSRTLYSLLEETMPEELVVFEVLEDDGRGRAQLTTEGKCVVRAMAWIL